VTCVLPKTFPSPSTRGINPVATIASANRHSWCRHRECIPSGEAKECQQVLGVFPPGSKRSSLVQGGDFIHNKGCLALEYQMLCLIGTKKGSF
jgi:hypothetical protein